MIIILKALYFMLPAYCANMAPVLVMKYFPKLAIPIHKEKLGSHKTWRGVLSAVVVSIIVTFIQKLIGIRSIVDYSNVSFVMLGFLLGFGAMFGDSLKSYFKRKRGIDPGKPWYGFDQVDYPLGAMMFASLIVGINWLEFTIILIGSFILTVAANHIAFRLGIRKTQW